MNEWMDGWCLQSELEQKAKETAEANRSMEDMRVKMQLDAIKTPAETKVGILSTISYTLPVSMSLTVS
jgi:hypothetical protein